MPVLLVEETEVPEKNHRPAASNQPQFSVKLYHIKLYLVHLATGWNRPHTFIDYKCYESAYDNAEAINNLSKLLLN